MTTPLVSVQFPDAVYEGLSARASKSQRTVQEELVRVVSLLIPGEPQIPAEFESQLAHLPSLTDDQLWDAAREQVASNVADRLDELSEQRRSRPLTEDERHEQVELLRECDRVLLLRAHAALTLQRRGHDISSLGPQA
jgi:hypothetical protein